MGAITQGSSYMMMWSVVCSIERAASVDIVRIRDMAIRELNNTGWVRVATGQNQTYVQQHTIDNWISSDYKQIDFVARFECLASASTSVLDNAYAYSWNTIAGRPMLPSGEPTNGGFLFAACSQGLTRERQGAVNISDTLADSVPYKQLCSQLAAIPNLNSGNVVGSGSIIDRLSSSRIENSTSPSTIGTNANNSTDFRTLASDTANEAGRTINNALGLDHNGGEGLSTNDIKFFAYAGLGLIALVAFTSVVRQVKTYR